MTPETIFRSKVVQLSVLVCGALLSGCAAQSHQPSPLHINSCQSGDPMAETTLYFGMSRPHGPNITEKEWQAFVDKEVTPRFRDGLTVFQGKGQWLGDDGTVAKESSHALMLIHGINDKEGEKNIEALRTIYKDKFQQESVMRVDINKCVSF